MKVATHAALMSRHRSPSANATAATRLNRESLLAIQPMSEKPPTATATPSNTVESIDHPRHHSPSASKPTNPSAIHQSAGSVTGIATTESGLDGGRDEWRARPIRSPTSGG